MFTQLGQGSEDIEHGYQNNFSAAKRFVVRLQKKGKESMYISFTKANGGDREDSWDTKTLEIDTFTVCERNDYGRDVNDVSFKISSKANGDLYSYALRTLRSGAPKITKEGNLEDALAQLCALLDCTKEELESGLRNYGITPN